MAGFASLDSTETLDPRVSGEDAGAEAGFFTSFEDAAKASALIPNDTLFSSQWHLFNTGQGGGGGQRRYPHRRGLGLSLRRRHHLRRL